MLSPATLSMDSPPEAPFDSLLRLPNELLLHIREQLGPSDLLSHASYYHLHPRTQACYTAYDDDPKFWISLLFESGLVIPSCGIDASSIAWRKAAHECPEHARVCAHPACGMQRLEANRDRLQEGRSSWDRQHWDGHSPLGIEPATERAEQIKQNPLVEHIGFNCNFPRHNHSKIVRSILIGACAFLKASPDDDDGWLERDLIDRHPVASHSFATFPPVKGFLIAENILDRHDSLVVVNVHGATVMDTLTALSTILSREMDQEDVKILMEYGIWPFYEHVTWSDDDEDLRAFPDEWSLDHIERVACCAGNLFQLTRWTGFSFSDMADEPTAFLSFESKKLPEDAWAHLAKYEYPKALSAAADATNGLDDSE